MRRLAVEKGQRRLRAGGGRIPALPGGPGWPSDPTTGVCLEWLDADSERRGNPAGVILRGHVLARKHGPGVRKRRGGAPRGDAIAARPPAKRIAQHATPSRLEGAPPPLVVSRGNCSPLGRFERRENGRAWLFEITSVGRERPSVSRTRCGILMPLRRSGIPVASVRESGPRICKAALRAASRPGNESESFTPCLAGSSAPVRTAAGRWPPGLRRRTG